MNEPVADASVWNAPIVARCAADRRAMRTAATPSGLWSAAVEAIAATEPAIHAWREVRTDRPRDPETRPIGVKDVIDVRGFPTRAGSRARDDAAVCETDAVVVGRLRDAGYVPVGKTHTTEFAFRDVAPTVNPFDPAHTPGGSSSGSAAAVAAGHVPIALGTQTAGSMCRPAAYCGIHAFKPTTGCTPSGGVTELAMSFDTVGVYGLTAEWAVDAAMTMLDTRAERTPTLRGLRFGMVRDPFFRNLTAECARALEIVANLLTDAGLQRVDISLDLDVEPIQVAHRAMMAFEAHRAHRSMLHAPDKLGAHWRALLETGDRMSDAQYHEAATSVARGRARILERTSGVDFVLAPPVRATAPRGLSNTGDAGLIIPWTYAGPPLAVLPSGRSESGLPLAVMLVGHPGADERLAAIVRAIAPVTDRSGTRAIDFGQSGTLD